MRRSLSIPLVLVTALAFGQTSKVAAEDNPGSTPSASSEDVAKPDEAPTADVNGFRSAKFGMSETDVRAAIASDFGASAAIKQTDNPTERTRGLSVHIPDLLPGGGAAEVAYVFGYKTKKLIQVSVIWSKAVDPSTTAQKLVADADVLRANFLTQGYQPSSIVTDALTRGGILVFRGADGAGHTTALLLEGRTALAKNQKSFAPNALLLLYIADPKHPDIFRLAPGQF